MSPSHAMDVRIAAPPRRWSWRVAGVVVAIAVLAVAAQAVRSRASAVTVDRATLVIATVGRGTLVREARGTGTLVAERSRIIAAETNGRVEAIRVQAGEHAGATTTVLVLANADTTREAADAGAALAMAAAELAAAEARLAQDVMALRGEVAQLDGEAAEADARAQSIAALNCEGLAAKTDLHLAQVRAAALQKRAALARERLHSAENGVASQLAAKRAAVAQARARNELQRGLVDALDVKASLAGIVQEVLVEPGQHVTAGQNLARIADPAALLARVHVAPAQARDLAPGLEAHVDTHSGVVAGKVMRVDPAVREGSVAVDIALRDPLPAGVRPDSPVEATIVLGTIARTLIVQRPANAEENTSVALFRVDPGNGEAHRVRAEFGRASVLEIEVRGGLDAGDRVIVSDTTALQDVRHIYIR